MPGYLVKTANFVAEIGNDEELAHLAQVDTIKKDTQICTLPGKTWIEAKKLPLLRKVWGLDPSGSVPPPIKVGNGGPKAPVKTSLPPPIETTIDANPLLHHPEAFEEPEEIIDLTVDAVEEVSEMPPLPVAATAASLPENEAVHQSSELQTIAPEMLVTVEDAANVADLDDETLIRSTFRGVGRPNGFEIPPAKDIEGVSDIMALTDATVKHEVPPAVPEANLQDLDNVLDYVAVVEDAVEPGDETRIDAKFPETLTEPPAEAAQEIEAADPAVAVFETAGAEPADVPPGIEEAAAVDPAPEQAESVPVDETSNDLLNDASGAATPDSRDDSKTDEQSMRDVSRQILARMREMSEMPDEMPNVSPDEATFVIESDRIEGARQDASAAREIVRPTIPDLDGVEPPAIAESIDSLSQELVESIPGPNIEEEATHPMTVSSMFNHQPGGEALPSGVTEAMPGAGDSIDFAFMALMPGSDKLSEIEEKTTIPLRKPDLSELMAEFVPESSTSNIVDDDLFSPAPGEISQLQTLKMFSKEVEQQQPATPAPDPDESKVTNRYAQPAASEVEPARPRSRFKKLSHRNRAVSAAMTTDPADSADVVSAQSDLGPEISQELKAAKAAVEAAKKAANDGQLDQVILERAASLVEALENAQKRSMSGVIPVTREHPEIKVDPEDDENPSDIFRIRRRGDVDLRYREEFHRISMENAQTTKYQPGKDKPPAGRDVIVSVDEDNSSSDKFRVRGRSELRRMLEAEAKAAKDGAQLTGVPISTEDFSRSSQGELRRLFEKEDELHLVLANEIREKELEVETKQPSASDNPVHKSGDITPPPSKSKTGSVTSSLPKRRNSVVSVAVTPQAEATHVTAAFGTETSQITFDSPFFEGKLGPNENPISRFGHLFLTSRRLWKVVGKKDTVKDFVSFDIENIHSLSIHEERRYFLLILDILLLAAAIGVIVWTLFKPGMPNESIIQFVGGCVGIFAIFGLAIAWVLSFKRYIQFGIGTNVLNAKITPVNRQDAMKFLNAVDNARFERRKELGQ